MTKPLHALDVLLWLLGEKKRPREEAKAPEQEFTFLTDDPHETLLEEKRPREAASPPQQFFFTHNGKPSGFCDDDKFTILEEESAPGSIFLDDRRPEIEPPAPPAAAPSSPPVRVTATPTNRLTSMESEIIQLNKELADMKIYALHKVAETEHLKKELAAITTRHLASPSAPPPALSVQLTETTTLPLKIQRFTLQNSLPLKEPLLCLAKLGRASIGAKFGVESTILTRLRT